MIRAAEWYDDNPDLERFHQGDIVKDVPFFIFPTHKSNTDMKRWRILRHKNPHRAIKDVGELPLPIELKCQSASTVGDMWSDPNGEYFVAVARKLTLMIVTRGCAIDKDSTKMFMACPVFKVSELAPEQQSDAWLNEVRALDKFDWFYLPSSQNIIEESFADLSQMMPIHRSFFGKKPKRPPLLERLTSYGQSELQAMLSDTYGTKFGFDFKDVHHQVAEYACSSCFYSNRGDVPRRQSAIGAPLGECPNCGQMATWVKMQVDEPK